MTKECRAETLGTEVRNLVATDSIERHEALVAGQVLADYDTELPAHDELKAREVQFWEEDGGIGILDVEGQGMTYKCRFSCETCAGFIIMSVANDEPTCELPDQCLEMTGQQR